MMEAWEIFTIMWKKRKMSKMKRQERVLVVRKKDKGEKKDVEKV